MIEVTFEEVKQVIGDLYLELYAVRQQVAALERALDAAKQEDAAENERPGLTRGPASTGTAESAA